MNVTIETMRERIVDHIENGQTSDSYSIGRAQLDWVPGRQAYLLTMPDGETDWEEGGCGDSIEYIDDEDICDFYNEEIRDYYDEAIHNRILELGFKDWNWDEQTKQSQRFQNRVPIRKYYKEEEVMNYIYE